MEARELTNLAIAELFRKVAAAYQITGGNRFRIMAYEKAADSIEHLTSELKDLWERKQLDQIPGFGESMAAYIEELFSTGQVKHFGQVLSQVPASVFPLLLVPGIGPKRAFALVTAFGIDDPAKAVEQLEESAKSHKIAELPGFGEKSEQDILMNIDSYRKGRIKENRMVLPQADATASELISYLKADPAVERADILGSLRRCVATIGDIDIAVVTKEPEEVVSRFVQFPHVKIIEQGPTGASLLLHNGRQVDLRVHEGKSYGAMLQYFTGSKHHNIALRTYALSRQLSLNEYGIKPLSDRHVPKGIGVFNSDRGLYEFKEERDFYHFLGMDWIPPEIREDRGEIAAALKHVLPDLIQVGDIQGDLHMHTKYDLHSSHDLGASTLTEHLDKAAALGYAYIGISDHNPSVTNQTDKEIVHIMKTRKESYEHEYYSWKERRNGRVQLLIMMEIDIQPDGKLALPDEAFEYIDAAVVSVHSALNKTKAEMTERILTALSANPKVKVLGHPTGRLFGSRDGFEADWIEVFKLCAKRNIAMEINAFPNRLDLPDAMVFDAIKHGVKLCIDTDAHDVGAMDLMKYGVSVARRGWATKHDIINTSSYEDMKVFLES